jgi:antitoxin MazE
MKRATKLELKVVRIGNSRGIRLPREILARYALGDVVVLEEHRQGLVLRGKKDVRLSWEATFKEMARERDDFRDFDVTLSDGLGGEGW